jgi:hypothetical protein
MRMMRLFCGWCQHWAVTRSSCRLRHPWADFPSGDARALYRSARRVLSLPGATRLFLCQDYKTSGRSEFRWETTVAAERAHNVHIHAGWTRTSSCAWRVTQLGMRRG